MYRTQQDIDNGLTASHFAKTIRRWAARENIDLAKIGDHLLVEVYNYIRDHVPVRTHSRSGNTTLIIKNSSSEAAFALQLTRLGEVWKLKPTTKKDRVRRQGVLQFGDEIGDGNKTDINDLREFNRHTGEKSAAETAELIRNMLYRRLCKLKLVPDDAQKNTKPVATRIEELKESLLDVTLRLEKRRRALVAGRFAELLNPHIVATTKEIGYPASSVGYNWLNAENNKTAHERRMQIAAQSPVMTHYFVKMPDITKAIDNGSSVPTAFAKSLGHTGPFVKSAVKLALKLGNEDLPPNRILDIPALIRILSHVNPNWYPKKPQDWDDLDTCQKTFHDYLRFTSNRSNINPFLEESGGNWKDYADLIRAHGDIRDIKDWLKAMTEKLIYPHLIATGQAISMDACEKIFSPITLIQGRKFFDILAASHRWHKEIDTFSSKIASISINGAGKGTFSWPALSDTMTAPNGIVIEPLTTPQELREEGTAQKHCVDGYSSNCLYYNSHIVSLRAAGTGERLVTVELKEVWQNAAGKKAEKPEGVYVAQSQGFQRRAPKTKEQDATNWYVRSIKPDWDRVIEHRAKAVEMRNRNEAILQIGYDYLEPDQRDKAFEICKTYLPSASDRNSSLEHWLERMGVVRPLQLDGQVIPVSMPQPHGGLRHLGH